MECGVVLVVRKYRALIGKVYLMSLFTTLKPLIGTATCSHRALDYIMLLTRKNSCIEISGNLYRQSGNAGDLKLLLQVFIVFVCSEYMFASGVIRKVRVSERRLCVICCCRGSSFVEKYLYESFFVIPALP